MNQEHKVDQVTLKEILFALNLINSLCAGINEIIGQYRASSTKKKL